MASEQTAKSAADGWTEPKPARVPAPTYMPATMALGIAFFLFGFVTSYAFTVAGLGLIAFALTKWIGDMLHDE
jgi:hypothetical protein